MSPACTGSGAGTVNCRLAASSANALRARAARASSSTAARRSRLTPTRLLEVQLHFIRRAVLLAHVELERAVLDRRRVQDREALVQVHGLEAVLPGPVVALRHRLRRR